MPKEFYFGIAIEILGNGVGVGLQMTGYINPTLGWIIIGVSTIVGLVLMIYGWRKKGDKTISFKQGKYAKATENILYQIHKRMLELKDKAVKQYYLTHCREEFLKLHTVLMNTYAKNEELEKLEKDLEGEVLSSDMVERYTQLDNLLEQLLPISPVVRSLEELLNFVYKVDRLAAIPRKTYRYRGLDERRNEDKKWNKLFRELQEIKATFSDDTLNKKIDEYISYSFGLSGLLWLTDLLQKMPITDLPTKYFGSEAYNPNITFDNKMTRLRGEIVTQVKELEAMDNESDKTVIKDTKVNLNVKNGDKATGMEVNKPAKLENIQIDVSSQNVRETIGFKSEQKNMGMFTMTVLCECGKPFSYTCVGYKPPSVTCPNCGKDIKVKP